MQMRVLHRLCRRMQDVAEQRTLRHLFACGYRRFQAFVKRAPATLMHKDDHPAPIIISICFTYRASCHGQHSIIQGSRDIAAALEAIVLGIRIIVISITALQTQAAGKRRNGNKSCSHTVFWRDFFPASQHGQCFRRWALLFLCLLRILRCAALRLRIRHILRILVFRQHAALRILRCLFAFLL